MSRVHAHAPLHCDETASRSRMASCADQSLQTHLTTRIGPGYPPEQVSDWVGNWTPVTVLSAYLFRTGTGKPVADLFLSCSGPEPGKLVPVRDNGEFWRGTVNM